MSKVVKKIRRPFKHIFSGAKKVVFGSPTKIDWEKPNELIMPPSPEEKGLLSSLMGLAYSDNSLAKGLLDRGRKYFDYGLNDAFKSALSGQRYYGATAMMFSPAKFVKFVYPALQAQKITLSGQLPSGFLNSLLSSAKHTIGSILDQTSRRGIVNSSITQKAIADAIKDTIDNQVRYLSQYSALARGLYSSALSGAGLGLDALGKYISTAGYLSQLGKEPFIMAQSLSSMPYNLYSLLRSSRFRITAQPIVHGGSSGLLGSLAGAIAQPIGSKIGGWIASWV